jgi:NAD+ kinase
VRALIYAPRGYSKYRRRLEEALRAAGVEWMALARSGGGGPTAADFLLVVGDDHAVLEAHGMLGLDVPPILGFSQAGAGGFLATVGIDEMEKAVRLLSTGTFELEEAPRLMVEADSQRLNPAINDVAIFPWRSATLMEYTLSVQGEFMWRDYADGVVVATPIGSTAYALSAGGPLLHQRANALVVVAVNSMDVTRRPLVVPLSAEIRIADIASTSRCYIIVDGVRRVKVTDEVRIYGAPKPLRFVRILSASSLAERTAKKIELAQELLKMPPSAKLVLKVLQQEGSLSYRDVVEKTLLPERTARLALSLLVEKGLVKRRAMLGDARRHVYSVA